MFLILTIFAVYLPIDSWQNEVLEEIQVRGEHFTNFPSIRPYDMKDCNILGSDELYAKLWLPSASAIYRYDTVNVLRLKPTVYYDRYIFTACIQPLAKFGRDSLPPNKVFMDVFSADYERAYVKLSGTNFNVFVGRERFAIGPSPRYNLLLSGHSEPMDWLHYSLQSGKMKLSFYITRLNDLYTKPLEYAGDTIANYVDAKRYLSIKRFDYSPTTWLNFGLSEAAIFGGEDFSLEIYHFNPIVFLQAYQYNWDKDINFLLNFDAKVFLNNWSFYIALLIDDFQLERDPNNEPNHFGVNAGVEIADLFGFNNTFMMVEYTAVSRYTYSHFIPYQRYRNLNTPIGSPFGPDYDEVYAKFIYHINSSFDIFSRISHLRKGETYVDSIWPIPEYPRMPGTSFPDNNFLSGIVQSSTDISIGLRFFHKFWLVGSFSVGYSYSTNFKHVRGETKESPFLNVQVDLINL